MLADHEDGDRKDFFPYSPSIAKIRGRNPLELRKCRGGRQLLR